MYLYENNDIYCILVLFECAHWAFSMTCYIKLIYTCYMFILLCVYILNFSYGMSVKLIYRHYEWLIGLGKLLMPLCLYSEPIFWSCLACLLYGLSCLSVIYYLFNSCYCFHIYSISDNSKGHIYLLKKFQFSKKNFKNTKKNIFFD